MNALCPFEGCPAGRVYPNGGFSSTCMGVQEFYDHLGHHIHDPNSTWRSFRCSNGHQWVQVLENRCPVEGCSFGSPGRITKCDFEGAQA